MKRVNEVKMEISCKNFKTALNRFFKKYPELEHWKEILEYIFENEDENDLFYLTVIERE